VKMLIIHACCFWH